MCSGKLLVGQHASVSCCCVWSQTHFTPCAPNVGSSPPFPQVAHWWVSLEWQSLSHIFTLAVMETGNSFLTFYREKVGVVGKLSKVEGVFKSFGLSEIRSNTHICAYVYSHTHTDTYIHEERSSFISFKHYFLPTLIHEDSVFSHYLLVSPHHFLNFEL